MGRHEWGVVRGRRGARRFKIPKQVLDAIADERRSSPTVEAAVSSPAQSAFESQERHQIIRMNMGKNGRVRELPLSAPIDPRDIGEARFGRWVEEYDYRVHKSTQWATDERNFDKLIDHAQNIEIYDSRIDGIFYWDNRHVIASISMYGQTATTWKFNVDAYGNTLGDINSVIADLQKLFPAATDDDEHIVTVKFWSQTERGPREVSRHITVPKFNELNGNYSAATHLHLEKMVRHFKPAHGGQLILWHGEPGTGKTYALRTLANEWREWCDFEYIVDPERLFGSDAAYLMQVMMQDSSYNYMDEDEVEQKKWRLLILEDTGELLSKDAKERAGQGLSRLLNVVDGLIGQGLRVLILITTNEEVGALHTAIARPGRAASRIVFEKLSAEESVMWAQEHGINVEPHAHTLAELYGALEGFEKAQERPRVGFAPR